MGRMSRVTKKQEADTYRADLAKISEARAKPILQRVTDPFDASFYDLNLWALAVGCLPREHSTVRLSRSNLAKLRDILISADLGASIVIDDIDRADRVAEQGR